MKVVWTAGAIDEYRAFRQSSPLLANKIDTLIEDIKRQPFTGLGKPEPLRGEFAGYWSRRIAKGHRLIYRITGKRGPDQRLEIVQCHFHYRK